MTDKGTIPLKTAAARTAFLVLGWLGLITAALLFGVVLYGAAGLNLGPGRHDFLASALFGPAGTAIILAGAILGVAGFIVARAVSRGKNWGRVAGIVLGIIVLPLIPLGTGVGLIALPGLFGAEAGTWFGWRR